MQREKWIEDAAEVVAESALYSAQDNGSAPDRAYIDASMHADSDEVVLDFIEADRRLSSRLGSGDVSDDLLREVRRLAVKTLDAGSTDPRKIKSSPALSGCQHTGATMKATFIEAVLTTEATPDLRAWIEAHADEVRAACLEAAPKLKAPKPASFDTPRRLGDVWAIKRGQDAKTSVWVDGAGAWLMQTGASRYLLQPWGITLTREEVMALPGLWQEAHRDAVGDVTGNLVVILDIGDGHGPLPRFAHADGRHAKIKIGRRRWMAYPSDKQPGYLGKLAVGGNVMLFENGDAWVVTETTAPARPAAPPQIRLTEQQKQAVDEVILSALGVNMPRTQQQIVNALTDTDADTDSGLRGRWFALYLGDDSGQAWGRHTWDSDIAGKLVRASLERLERAGRAMKAKGGWLRA